MDPKGFEQKPWFPYLKNMYDEIGGDMMDVDAKGYEEKPWWPYVLDLQQKIDASGGGGGDITIAKVTMSAGRSAPIYGILVPLAQIIHENPEMGAPNTMLVSVHTLKNGSTIPNAEVPLFRGKCIVSGLSDKPTTITGAAEYNAEQQMLIITGDCTLEW